MDEQAFASFIRRGRNAPLARRSGGINVVDFTDASSLYDGLPPHRKLLLLVLLLALKDEASEVRFEPWAGDPEGRSLRMFYEVGGQLHELVPPPRHLSGSLIREVEAVAGFRTMRRRFAGLLRRMATRLDGDAQQSSRSRFKLKSGRDEVEVTATVYGSATGDRVFLGLPDRPASLSERARDATERIFAARKN